jgi:hypothetical protein
MEMPENDELGVVTRDQSQMDQYLKNADFNDYNSKILTIFFKSKRQM